VIMMLEVLYESGKNACCASEASKGKGKAIPVEGLRVRGG
jgi:hypothetical protein